MTTFDFRWHYTVFHKFNKFRKGSSPNSFQSMTQVTVPFYYDYSIFFSLSINLDIAIDLGFGGDFTNLSGKFSNIQKQSRVGYVCFGSHVVVMELNTFMALLLFSSCYYAFLITFCIFIYFFIRLKCQSEGKCLVVQHLN